MRSRSERRKMKRRWGSRCEGRKRTTSRQQKMKGSGVKDASTSFKNSPRRRESHPSIPNIEHRILPLQERITQ